jgi:hypothetical protein
MADIMNYQIKQIGNSIRIYGDVVDSETQTHILATFGPNGLAFDAWWAGKSVEEKIMMIQLHLFPYILGDITEKNSLSNTRG